MKLLILMIAVSAMLTGCFNVTTHLAPKNLQVPVKLVGEDCTPILFGIGWGTNTVEAALANGRHHAQRHGNYANLIAMPIVSIRSIALQDSYLLGFGERCIVVEGAP